MLICPTLLGWSNDVGKVGGRLVRMGKEKGVHRVSVYNLQERHRLKSEYNIKLYRQEVEHERGLHLSGSGPVDGYCDNGN